MNKEKYVGYPKNLEPINRNIDELNRIARLMKGKPLYLVLEKLADKLSS